MPASRASLSSSTFKQWLFVSSACTCFPWGDCIVWVFSLSIMMMMGMMGIVYLKMVVVFVGAVFPLSRGQNCCRGGRWGWSLFPWKIIQLGTKNIIIGISLIVKTIITDHHHVRIIIIPGGKGDRLALWLDIPVQRPDHWCRNCRWFIYLLYHFIAYSSCSQLGSQKDILVLPEVAGEALLSFSVRLEANCAKNWALMSDSPPAVGVGHL